MNWMQNRWLGHLACFLAYSIFGFNIIVCKSLTSSTYLSPMGIFLLRSVGAGAIFWLLSLLMPGERVARRDLPKIFVASLLGFFLTQLSFLAAIPLITPMESSIMSSLTPIYTMFIAAVAVREPITVKKAGGVLLSLAGVLYLIMGMKTAGGVQQSSPLGIALMVGNALFFAMYLGIFRPLIERYTVVTFMKWIFLFSTVMSAPFAYDEVLTLDYTALPSRWLWELSYLIIMATFVAYYLIPLGQKLIRPTLVSMYSYAQPIIAISISIAIGMDSLTAGRVVATLVVFAGVVIVSRSRSAKSDAAARIKNMKQRCAADGYTHP